MSFLLLVLEVWALAGLVLTLHYYSSRLGFAPFLFIIGALGVLVQGQLGIYFQPLPGFYMFLSSNVFVPIMLMGVLVIYVSDGAVPARMTMFSVLGIGLLVILVQFLYRLHLSLPDGGSLTGLPIDVLVPRLNLRNSLSSFISFGADMLVIAIFYQGVKNLAARVPEWAIIGLALLASLWTDAILYHLLADFGTDHFATLLPGDVLGKTISALVLWLPVAYYLVKIAPTMPNHLGGQNRRTLDVLFGSLQDMKMALVHTETALQKSESERLQEAAYLHLISDHIAEALWLADPKEHEHAFYVNPAYEKIWGRSAASLYADPFSFVHAIHPEDQGRVLASLAHQLKEAHEVEYRVIRPDGTICWVRDRSFPVFDEQGNVHRIAGITEDITERKDIEKKSLELAVERERVKLLRDFVSEASHDLKSPLTAINLKVYHLSKTDDPERKQSLVKELERISTQMGSMIDDLLTLARLESIDDLQLIRFRLDSLLGEITTPIRPQAEAKKVALIIAAPQDEIRMQADMSDLSRALANLIDNAVHYTPTGGEVTVESEISPQQVIIRVRDTGIGIDEADQLHIFNRFYRAPNARSADPTGTGLGLAIVKKIIDRHQGRIECVSILGKGSMFTVILPLAN